MLIINTEALSEFHDYEPGYRRFDSWRKPAVYEIKNGRLKQIESQEKRPITAATRKWRFSG